MKNTKKKLNTNKTKEINKVLICGLGGVGCVCASTIFDSNKFDLKILVDENRYKKYSQIPTTFNGKEYPFDYILPTDINFKADLIIIATKNDGLNTAIKNIKNFVSKDTIILSVLNGIHSEAQIAEIYGWDNVLISFYIGNSCVRTNRNITQDGNYEFIIGDKNNQNSENIQKIKNFLDKSNIKHKISNHILERYWKKFMVNVGLNQLCAVENKTFKEIKQEPKLIEKIKKLIWEVKLLAEKEGINNPQKLYDDTIKFLIEDFEDAIPSMLQDIRQKRTTEVDIFAGEIIKLGEKHNISVQENKKIYKEIKEIEKNF